MVGPVKPAERNKIIIGMQPFRGSALKFGVFTVHPDNRFVEFNQLAVLPAPGIGPPVVRIRKPAQPRLVAVINRGRPGPGHLDHHRLHQDRLVDVLVGRLRSQVIGTPHLMVGPGQKTRMVVVGQLIHGSHPGRHGHAGPVIGHGIEKVIRVAQQVHPAVVAVLFHPR